MQWLEQGDLNTKYFHSMMKARRNMNRIFSIIDVEGVNRTKMDEITKSFIDFYTNFLGTTNKEREHVNSSMIQQGPIVIEIQRSMLEEKFTEKEVKTTLWAINGDKSPGLDGYGSKFFKDLCEATGYQKGSLPFRYLGVLISAKKLSIMDCEILID